MSATAKAAERRRVEATGLERVYVWELPVRLTHWLIALSIFVLIFTGFYIGHPFLTVTGQARFHFVMGTMKAIHLYTAVVFTAAVLARVLWMFQGNEYARWDQFVPTTRDRWKKLGQTVAFYTFLRRDPPPVVGHNPLAGATYLGLFALYGAMIGTGLALQSTPAASGSIGHAFRVLVPLFGGLQTARWIHHVGMWLLLMAFVHHLNSALTMSLAERTGIFDSIFSGFKFLRRGSAHPRGGAPK